jgi:hypothetical protein
MTSLRFVFVLAVGAIAGLPTASAWQYGHCVSTSVVSCRPVCHCSQPIYHCSKPIYHCPRPTCPSFCMYPIKWDRCGYVAWSPDQPIHVPASVGVIGYSCYCWYYKNTEYQFALYDDCGRQIRDAFVLTPDIRHNRVCPGRTLVDDLRIHIAPGKLVLGKRYTLRVCLRGHSVSFPIIPVAYSNPSGPQSSPQVIN